MKGDAKPDFPSIGKILRCHAMAFQCLEKSVRNFPTLGKPQDRLDVQAGFSEHHGF